MAKYQVSYSRRDYLSIEVEAYNTDDAIDKAEALLYNPNKFDIDEGDCELEDVIELGRDPDDDREAERDDKADRGDWEYHQAHDQ
jgi:hypothetical protein